MTITRLESGVRYAHAGNRAFPAFADEAFEPEMRTLVSLPGALDLIDFGGDMEDLGGGAYAIRAASSGLVWTTAISQATVPQASTSGPGKLREISTQSFAPDPTRALLMPKSEWSVFFAAKIPTMSGIRFIFGNALDVSASGGGYFAIALVNGALRVLDLAPAISTVANSAVAIHDDTLSVFGVTASPDRGISFFRDGVQVANVDVTHTLGDLDVQRMFRLFGYNTAGTSELAAEYGAFWFGSRDYSRPEYAVDLAAMQAAFASYYGL